MSTLFVDTINEKTSGNGVAIPGHVVQIQGVNPTTAQSISSASYSDLTGYSITFTPKFSNSKLFFSWCYHVYVQEDSGWTGVDTRLVGGSTTLSDAGTYGTAHNLSPYDNDRQMQYQTRSHILTLSSASAVTYKIQAARVKLPSGGRAAQFNEYGGDCNFTIMEIAQ